MAQGRRLGRVVPGRSGGVSGAGPPRLGVRMNVAQLGGKHPDAVPLKGFGGAGVLEAVEDFDGNTYRLMYTVRLGDRIYALHAFQKKSTRGIKTPQHEMMVVRQRYLQRQEMHRQWLASQPGGEP